VLTERRLVVARTDDVAVVHEALLTGWPRLHGWLEDGRVHAAVRERLASAVAAWDESDRDRAELFRGTRLQPALDLAAADPETLTPLERDFLDESVAEAERRLADERSRTEREARGRRRARTAAVALALALVVTALAGGYAITQQRRAADAATTAERAALSADAGRLGALARAGGDYDQALLLAAQAVALDRSPATESDLFTTLLRGNAVRRVIRAPERLSAVGFMPDGGSLVAATLTGEVLRWPVAGGPPTARLDPGAFAFVEGYGADVDPLQVTGDGRLLVLAGKTLRLVDPVTGAVVAEGPDIGEDVWSPADDGKAVVAAAPVPSHGETWNYASDTEVLIWRLDAAAREPQHVRIGAAPLRISPCGRGLACVLTKTRHLVRIRTSDGVVAGDVALATGITPADPPTMVADPDGRQVALSSTDGVVRLVDVRTGRVVRELGGATRPMRVLAFSRDGRRVAAADTASVLVWRTDRIAPAEHLDAHGGQVRSASWSPDGTTLASASEDGTVILWDVAGQERSGGAVVTEALPDRTNTLWPVHGSVVVGQFDGGLTLVDPHDGALTRAKEHPHEHFPIDSIGSSSTGNLLVTTDFHGTTAVWDLRAARLLGTVPLPPPASNAVVDAWVSPDGVHAALLRDEGDGPLIVDLRTRQVVRHLPPLSGPPADAVGVAGWTRDGGRLLVTRSGSGDASQVLVVDAMTGRITLRLRTGDPPQTVDADPTGRYLAVGTHTGHLLVFDAHDGHPLAPPLQANDGTVNTVSISPDGRYISTSGGPPRVMLWNSRTFRPVGSPLPVDMDAPDAHARFDPDGRLVLSAGRVVRAIIVDPEQWVASACTMAGRVLSRAEWQQFLPDRPYAPACR
jgi:WD40 repeat protein